MEEVLTSSRHSRKMQFKASELDVRILNCHTGHTKRIVPETPDSLLTVSEVENSFYVRIIITVFPI